MERKLFLAEGTTGQVAGLSLVCSLTCKNCRLAWGSGDEVGEVGRGQSRTAGLGPGQSPSSAPGECLGPPVKLLLSCWSLLAQMLTRNAETHLCQLLASPWTRSHGCLVLPLCRVSFFVSHDCLPLFFMLKVTSWLSGRCDFLGHGNNHFIFLKVFDKHCLTPITFPIHVNYPDNEISWSLFLERGMR